MKALVLSGGKGSRLRPLTYSGAKQLVPLGNKPVLFYVIEDIVAAGISEIGIVVGDTAEQIRAAVGDGSQFGAHVTYIHQNQPGGLAHAVQAGRAFLGAEPFVLYLGDNFIESGIQPFVTAFESSQAHASILLCEVPNPEQFGIADLSGERIKLEEKPAVPRSNLALVGIYFFDANIHLAADSIHPSARGELEITDAISWLIENDYQVNATRIQGWWIDTGKMEDMLDANRLVLEKLEQRIEGAVSEDSTIQGSVVVDAGARVEKSTLRGPLIIGAGTVIRNSFIGPFTAIGSRCEITNSEVEHSIVMEGTTILDLPLRLADSLIGRETRIGKGGRQPRSFKMMLGDHSRVDVE